MYLDKCIYIYLYTYTYTYTLLYIINKYIYIDEYFYMKNWDARERAGYRSVNPKKIITAIIKTTNANIIYALPTILM